MSDVSPIIIADIASSVIIVRRRRLPDAIVLPLSLAPGARWLAVPSLTQFDYRATLSVSLLPGHFTNESQRQLH